MYIVDFDGTIFDTYRFAEDRMKSLSQFGVTKIIYQEAYSEARNGVPGFVSYSDRRHAQVLAARGFDEEKIFEALKNITDNCQHYLFPYTKKFLENLKATGEELVLLSLGDPNYQELKVKNSGIHGYFDRVFMVSDDKTKIIGEIISHTEDKIFWFINDKPGETFDIVRQFTGFKSVMMVSKFFTIDDYKKTGLPFFETLEEVEKFIQNN